MDDLHQDDRLAIVAAQLIHVRYTANKFGPENGFGICDVSKQAMESGYVKLVADLLGVTVHIAGNIAPRYPGGHPYRVWIERSVV